MAHRRDELRLEARGRLELAVEDFEFLTALLNACVEQAQLLGPLALGDVGDRRQDERPLIAYDRIEADLDRDLGPILSYPVEVAPGAHRARDGGLRENVAQAYMPVAEALGDQQLDRSAEQLRARITEQLLGLHVHVDDLACVVHHHHRIRRGFDDQLELVVKRRHQRWARARSASSRFTFSSDSRTSSKFSLVGSSLPSMNAWTLAIATANSLRMSCRSLFTSYACLAQPAGLDLLLQTEDGDGMACHRGLLVGRDDGHREVAEPAAVLADAPADDLGVFPDAAGKDERIQAAERRGKRAELAHDPVDEKIDRFPGRRSAAREERPHIFAQAGDPEQTGTLPQQVAELVDRHPAFEQIQ